MPDEDKNFGSFLLWLLLTFFKGYIDSCHYDQRANKNFPRHTGITLDPSPSRVTGQ